VMYRPSLTDSLSLQMAVSGLAFSTATVPGFTLTAELCGPANRTRYCVRMWSYGWDVKTLLLAPFSYMIVVSLQLSWRYLQAISAMIILFQAAMCLIYVPESPRWLIDQGRFEEADAVMESLLGEKPSPSFTVKDAAPVPTESIRPFALLILPSVGSTMAREIARVAWDLGFAIL